MSASRRQKGRRGAAKSQPGNGSPEAVPEASESAALEAIAEEAAPEAPPQETTEPDESAEPAAEAAAVPELLKPEMVEPEPADPETADPEAAEADADPDSDEVPGEDTAARPGLEKAPPVTLGLDHLETIVESLVFVSDRPQPANRLARIVRAPTRDVETILERLVTRYQGRGIELAKVAGGYQFRSAAASAPFVRDLVAKKPVRLSRAQVETLAIMAYRQPLTRPELEEIRGVDSGSALKVLLEKSLCKILGRKDEAGRPLLYGTTPAFLELFGLSSLSELPTLREHTELTDESRALFRRRMEENIESIGEMDMEARHYTDEEIEAAEASALRDRAIEDGVPDQTELPIESAGDGETDGAPSAGDGEDDE